MSSAQKLRLAIRLTGALCMLGMLAGCGPDSRLRNYTMGGDFTLPDHNGAQFSLKKLRGKVVLLFFGFTNCPDICPAALGKARDVARRLNRPGAPERLQIVFISIDPDRDTAEVLRRYLARYQTSMIGQRGTPTQLSAVARQYGGTFARSKTKTAAGYLMSHPPFLYLVDPKGKLRYIFKPADPVDLVAELAGSLL